MTDDAPPTWQEEVAAVEDAFERSGVNPTWPDDEPGNIGPMAAAMADEIERLRRGNQMSNILHQLEREEDDANLAFLRGEVERLRLTDAEREAVKIAVEYVGSAFQVEHYAAVLRGLLDRLK